MKLDELIEYIEYKDLVNFKSVDITGISYNSLTTKSGDIFICLVGEHTDGHKFARQAIENGAAALLVERPLDEFELPQIVVNHTRRKIADIADRFYSRPSMGINLLGVTGTNGKTTVTHLVQKIIEENNKKCALIGTLGYKLSSGGEYRDTKHTTPQAPELQAMLRMIKDVEKIEDVVMEVSSHALEQNRVGGCRFKGAIFTNLTQDHLDYHVTMDNYFESKAILFKGLAPNAFVVVNVDDNYAQRFLDVVPAKVKTFTYGIKNPADIMAKDISFSPNGAEFTLSVNNNVDYKVNLHMNGMFSVYNVLAAISSAIAMGIEVQVALSALERIKGVAGRFEVVVKKPLVIVDYAHTPDGLENVLRSAREITPKGGKLICVFGCGGDRDATKRPKMGAIAESLCDKIVITSDNPRSEDPQQIITDIIAGLKSVNPDKVTVEPDRGKAIALLKAVTGNNDVVVIAGKGHEDYQIIGREKTHFSDVETAKKFIDPNNHE